MRNPWGLILDFDDIERQDRIELKFKMPEDMVIKYGLESQHP